MDSFFFPKKTEAFKTNFKKGSLFEDFIKMN